MKIEKLNENQIRCTLSKADLEDHNIRLTELAYGTDRAKALFRDMMQKASDDVGFEVGDIPLMIEAIPVNPDCLVLIVTKVEDPEELDTRFSKFTKPAPDDDYEDEDEDEFYEDTDEADDSQTIFDMLDNIVENLEAERMLLPAQIRFLLHLLRIQALQNPSPQMTPRSQITMFIAYLYFLH